jgi:hypothetical protein
MVMVIVIYEMEIQFFLVVYDIYLNNVVVGDQNALSLV